MGRSQRADRNPGIFNQDAYGDAHYPGTGQTAQGATINPAVKAGNPFPYVYDWAKSWPSGSANGVPIAVPPIGDVEGPFDADGQGFYVRKSDWHLGFDLDGIPPADAFISSQELDATSLSEQQKAIMRAKMTELGWPGDAESSVSVPDTPWTRHADADAWYQAYLGGQGIDGWESMSLAEKHAAALAASN